MKRNLFTYILAAAVLAGCGSSDSFENKLFINGDNMRNEVRVAVDEKVTTVTKTVTVAVAQPLGESIDVSFVESPELLDTYRRAYYDPEAELLPAGHCDLSSLKAVIKAGDVTSGGTDICFVGLGENGGLDYDRKYVLPVSIISDALDVLPSARTMYFVVRRASLVNVASGMKSNCAWPDWGDLAAVHDMESFTFEALLCGTAFDNESHVHTVMGIEDKFLVRVGDAGIPGGQLQVAWAAYNDDGLRFRGNLTGPEMQLKPGQWYHIAVTFDGGADKTDGADVKVYFNGRLRGAGKCAAKDDSGKTMPITKVDFMIPHSDEMDGKPRCFWLGYSYDSKRSFDGMMSEVRVWNRALTADEINAPSHFYTLYPDSSTGLFPESLVAYWKFDEGTGKTVTDRSASGRGLIGEHDFIWYPVDLPVQE